MRGIVAGSLAALALCSPVFAAPVVDGNVADWGITVADGNGSNFTTANVPGYLLGTRFFFTHEDQPDTAGDGYFLGPNYGGQNYDVEFMGVAVDDAKLYIVIVTGQRPDNGFQRFSPGDIRIVADDGHVYGIEVGGGPGGAANAGLLTEDGATPGSTYHLDGNGWTVGHSESARIVGSVWRDADWLLDPIAPGTPVQLASTGGELVGMADFVYTRNDDPTREHAVIELSLDRNLFLTASSLDIFWAPSCGNDVLEIRDDLPARVPAPGSLAALAAGALAWRSVHRRR